MLESIFRDRDVKWITNAKIDKVTDKTVEVTEINEDGSVKKTHSLPQKFAAFIPGFRGVDCLKDEDGKWIEGLANPRGFVLVDKFQRNPTYKNIFAVGVCVAIPPFETTPVPVGVPKTGYMIESMVTATTHNIKELMDGQEPSHLPTWNAVCLADFGDNGVAFVALPQIPPCNVNWSSQGYWVHLAKIGFEKYFLRKVRIGSSEPGYEKIVMKALGIARIKGRSAA
jgi:sulfide:quinone oxidoreductase